MYRSIVGLAVLCGALRAQTPDLGFTDFQQRWDQYVDRSLDLKRIGILAAETAFDSTFRLNRCGRPPYCFPDRFGGAMVRRTTRSTMELAAGAILREDVRRKRSGLTGIRPRVLFALKQAALLQGPDGHWRPAYSRFAGSFAAVAVSTAWDGRPLTAPHLMTGFGITVSNYVQDSLTTEFEPDITNLARRAWRTYVRKPRPAASLTP